MKANELFLKYIIESQIEPHRSMKLTPKLLMKIYGKKFLKRDVINFDIIALMRNRTRN